MLAKEVFSKRGCSSEASAKQTASGPGKTTNAPCSAMQPKVLSAYSRATCFAPSPAHRHFPQASKCAAPPQMVVTQLFLLTFESCAQFAHLAPGMAAIMAAVFATSCTVYGGISGIDFPKVMKGGCRNTCLCISKTCNHCSTDIRRLQESQSLLRSCHHLSPAKVLQVPQAASLHLPFHLLPSSLALTSLQMLLHWQPQP